MIYSHQNGGGLASCHEPLIFPLKPGPSLSRGPTEVDVRPSKRKRKKKKSCVTNNGFGLFSPSRRLAARYIRWLSSLWLHHQVSERASLSRWDSFVSKLPPIAGRVKVHSIETHFLLSLVIVERSSTIQSFECCLTNLVLSNVNLALDISNSYRKEGGNCPHWDCLLSAARHAELRGVQRFKPSKN